MSVAAVINAFLFPSVAALGALYDIFLARAGIELDADSLDALIEAAVFKLPGYFELDGDVIAAEAAAEGIPPEEQREITVKI